MTKSNSTDITFVIDRSGSMRSIAEAMNSGFEEVINKQKLEPGECRVSVAQFDDKYESVFTARPITEVTTYRLEPRGSTALLDAIGRTVAATGQRLAALPEGSRPGQVLFVIITDGLENASVEYSRKAVFDMITHQRQKYGWEFIFLGANQDAIAVAGGLGISAGNAVTYTADKLGTSSLNSGLSAGISSMRSGRARSGQIYGQQDYNVARAAAGAVVPPVGPLNERKKSS
jgi:hypothetical protein